MNKDKSEELVKAGLMQMIEGLKVLDSHLSECEIEEILKQHVLPELLKDKALCGTSIFSKMEVIKTVQFDSILDEKSNGMQESISYMNADAICWMSEHYYNLDQLFKVVDNTNRLGDDVSKNEGFIESIKGLKKDANDLCNWLLGDAFERNQSYEYELKQLNGRN